MVRRITAALAGLAVVGGLDLQRLAPRPLRRALASQVAAVGALGAVVAAPPPAQAAKASNAATSARAQRTTRVASTPRRLPSAARRPRAQAGSRVNKDPESLLRNGLPIQGSIGGATKKLDVARPRRRLL